MDEAAVGVRLRGTAPASFRLLRPSMGPGAATSPTRGAPSLPKACLMRRPDAQRPIVLDHGTRDILVNVGPVAVSSCVLSLRTRGGWKVGFARRLRWDAWRVQSDAGGGRSRSGCRRACRA